MIETANKYHIKDVPLADNEIRIYCGRGSVLGNKWSSKKNTKADFLVNSRKEAILKYEHWLNEQIINKNKDVCNELNKIYKLVKEGLAVKLVCYCKPKACHTDIIKKIIEERI